MTTCMMTYPPARCTLPVGHDGPHATRDGHGWHDHDDMGVGVTAVLIEKEAKESPSVDYEAMWWEAERRAEKAEAERDRWHSMWRQRRIKNLAPADITLHSANSASWVRVRVEHPALGVIEEGIPLPTRSVPNVVTDEMVKRGMGALGELHEDGDLIDGSTVAHQRAVYAVLTDALTEPPPRPEGAEYIEALIDRAGTEGEGADNESLADYLARNGVRIVTEEHTRACEHEVGYCATRTPRWGGNPEDGGER